MSRNKALLQRVSDDKQFKFVSLGENRSNSLFGFPRHPRLCRFNWTVLSDIPNCLPNCLLIDLLRILCDFLFQLDYVREDKLPTRSLSQNLLPPGKNWQQNFQEIRSLIEVYPNTDYILITASALLFLNLNMQVKIFFNNKMVFRRLLFYIDNNGMSDVLNDYYMRLV